MLFKKKLTALSKKVLFCALLPEKNTAFEEELCALRCYYEGGLVFFFILVCGYLNDFCCNYLIF
jgi:hypothetical protein